jgi:type II secretory ATPase GspE/PulE/Tfp pilus assembly ATPase PilB-like protein
MIHKLDEDAWKKALRAGPNPCIEWAKQSGASDLHISPTTNAYDVRLRLGGVLSKPVQMSTESGRSLIQAFKAASKMNIAETRRPQDGRLSMPKVDLRLATHPCLHGENLVIRLLSTHQALPLTSLGLPEHKRLAIEHMAAHEAGLLLLAGATGSGKTTTLHAVINSLGERAGRITTLEDPVEIINPHALQTDLSQLNHLSFAAGLRSLMRQDPDTILVGEIRDEETAELALQAALTGHRVLASIHAPDCVGALCRLTELNVRWGSLLNCLNGIVAQRLLPATSEHPARRLKTEILNLRQVARNRLMNCQSFEDLIHLQTPASFLPFERTEELAHV